MFSHTKSVCYIITPQKLSENQKITTTKITKNTNSYQMLFLFLQNKTLNFEP